MPSPCPHCARPMVELCMACRGKVGGSKRSEQKKAAARANAKRPRKKTG